MQFNQLFLQAIHKIDNSISLFSMLEDNPEMILTEIYKEGADNFITRIFDSSVELLGEVVEVHDLQDYLYKLLIPYLKETPLLKGKELIYDSEKYPAPLQILLDGNEIAQLNIYSQEIIIFKHPDILKEVEQLSYLEKDFEYNANKIQRFENYSQDIMSYGETTFEKMKISMNKNKYQKKVKEQLGQLIEASLEFEQTIISQRLRVERIYDNLREFEDMKYKMATHFRDAFKYKIVS